MLQLQGRKRMSRDLELLHPEMRRLCQLFVAECRQRGLIVGISDTWRSKAEQDALYAQGRTKPGSITDALAERIRTITARYQRL